MEKIFFIMSFFVLSVCFATDEKSTLSPDRTAEYAMQHTYFAVAIARYYCANSAWPKNISELKTKSVSSKIEIVQKIDWGYFEQGNVEFEMRNSKQVYLRTPENSQEGIMSVSALHGIPLCKGEDMKLDFRPVLGG